MEKFKCVICGSEVEEYGNNPMPVEEEGKCCDLCNLLIVIPARMGLLNTRRKTPMESFMFCIEHDEAAKAAEWLSTEDFTKEELLTIAKTLLISVDHQPGVSDYLIDVESALDKLDK